MAPREATTPFPDQYLTLDYETAGPIVMPHDPTPAGGVADGGIAGGGIGGGGDGDEQSLPDQQGEGEEGGGVAVGNGEDGIAGGSLGGEGGNVSALGLEGSTSFGVGSGLQHHPSIVSSSSSLMSGAVGGGDSAGGASGRHGGGTARSHVDPLSIDPTSDDGRSWDTATAGAEAGSAIGGSSAHLGSSSFQVGVDVSTLTAPYAHESLATDSASVGHPFFGSPTLQWAASAVAPGPRVVSRANSTASAASIASLSTTSTSSAPLSAGSPFPPSSPVGSGHEGVTARGSCPQGSQEGEEGRQRRRGLLEVSSPGLTPRAIPRRIPAGSSGIPGVTSSETSDGVASPAGTTISSASHSSVGSTLRAYRRSSSRRSRIRTHSHNHRHHPHVVTSVLDHSTSLDSSDEEDDSPDLDTTNISDSSDDHINSSRLEGIFDANAAVTLHPRPVHGVIVADEDASISSSASASPPLFGAIDQTASINSEHDGTPNIPLPSQHSPALIRSGSSASVAAGSLRMLHRNPAFDLSSPANFAGSPHTIPSSSRNHPSRHIRHQASSLSNSSSSLPHPSSPLGSVASAGSPLTLSFGPSTTVSDLKYFAERGCIVALLAALHTPRLKTLGARMLADYAKMPDRRVAVASNRRILEFVSRTMIEPPTASPSGSGPDSAPVSPRDMGKDWLAREYAVETVRSLTATEESDGYLMGCPGLLRTLALVARGGPFVSETGTSQDSSSDGAGAGQFATGLASSKARLHACIAVMNLSCGKSNKIEIASIPDVLEAMRDVMIGADFSKAASSEVASEARLKAVTCIKNLSNADANDGALLSTPGLVEALGVVAEATCDERTGATASTTNACLALMNLSISKSNKHRVFRAPGVMDALMAVITRTCSSTQSAAAGGDTNPANAEARVKACSALSNLAIGYDNKIPMFSYDGFVDAILKVIETDEGEARTKACSILWSFAAEMKNQVPVVQRGDILPTLVRVAEEDGTTEARFKCVAALTLLAESLENAVPLLESGALAPLMDILHDAGPDPTQWKGQTASWCVGFLMNMAQSDEAVPALREAGVVELLAPLLTLDHYQSLKAAMAVTFVCRYDEGDETYDLLRKTENVIPKIISLLHNTLAGRGGNGYKYGVFTLRSSVGCIASLASGPDFMKERIATEPVFKSLLQVLSDFCVSGGTPGAIVGGGRDDALSATLAVRALQSLVAHLIPIPGSSALPFGSSMDEKLLTAMESFEHCTHVEVKDETRKLATDAKTRIKGSEHLNRNSRAASASAAVSAAFRHMTSNHSDDGNDDGNSAISFAASLASSCCGIPSIVDDDFCFTLPSPVGFQHPFQQQITLPSGAVAETSSQGMEVIEMDDSFSTTSSVDGSSNDHEAVRTFLLADSRTGRKYAVPVDPTGGRAFNDDRVWCYRRGRFCRPEEVPDPNFRWTEELQAAYTTAIAGQRMSTTTSAASTPPGSPAGGRGSSGSITSTITPTAPMPEKL